MAFGSGLAGHKLPSAQDDQNSQTQKTFNQANLGGRLEERSRLRDWSGAVKIFQYRANPEESVENKNSKIYFEKKNKNTREFGALSPSGLGIAHQKKFGFRSKLLNRKQTQYSSWVNQERKNKNKID